MSFMSRVRGLLPGGAPSAAPTAAPRPGATYMRGNRGSVFAAWRPFLRSEQSERALAWDDAAARVQDTLHNSGWLAGAIEQAVANTVGAEGLRFRPAPEHEEFGFDAERARAWSQRLGRRWGLYSTTPRECDARGMQTVAQLLASAFQSWLATGEVLAIIGYRRRPWGQWGTKVRLLHPGRLARRTDPTRRIVNGVQVDADGAPIAYLIRVKDRKRLGVEAERLVPARDRFGRPRVVHVFTGPPETYRGISPLAPALQALRQFDQLSDATLTAAIIQTVFAASFTTDGAADEAVEGLLTPQEQARMRADGLSPLEAYTEMVADFYDGADIDVGMGGRIAHLFPGQKLEFHNAGHPNANYRDYSADLKREFARCLGMLYESATGDYQGATYASLGRGLAEIYEVTKVRRAHVLAPLMRALTEAFVEEEIDSGSLDFPEGVLGFLRNRAAATRGTYAGAARPIAEELKLSKAHSEWIGMGAMSLTHVCRELGIDYSDVVTDLQAEAALRAAYGVPDPAAVRPPGTPAPADESEPDEDDDQEDDDDAD